jgi:hypothetical protein
MPRITADIRRFEVVEDICELSSSCDRYMLIVSHEKGIYYLGDKPGITYRKRGFMYIRNGGEHGFLVTRIYDN